MNEYDCDKKIDLINETIEQLEEIKKELDAEGIENSLDGEIDNLEDAKEYYIDKRDGYYRKNQTHLYLGM